MATFSPTLTASNLTGDIAAARMSTNIRTAISDAGGVRDAEVAAAAAIAKSKYVNHTIEPFDDRFSTVTAFTQTVNTVQRSIDLSALFGVILGTIYVTFSVSAKSDGSTWGITATIRVTYSDNSTLDFAATEQTFTTTLTAASMQYAWSFSGDSWPLGAGGVMVPAYAGGMDKTVTTTTNNQANKNGLRIITVALMAYRSTVGTGTATTNVDEMLTGGFRLA
mgnify:CR=1 FL=1